MHRERTNLDFQRIAAGHHRRVKRLVAVGLRHRDIILEPARHRLPHRMDQAEHAIALGLGLHQHPHGGQIVNLADILVVAAHLSVNAVKMLGASANLRLHAGGNELLAKLRHRVVDEGLPLLPLLLHVLHEIVIDFRLQIAETQIFQLALDIRDTEPVRQRRVNLDGLPGDAFLLVRTHIFQRPHIVQPIRQFDEDDAQILCHRQKQLAIILQLLLFF